MKSSLRVGWGYDVHPVMPGKGLRLGGVDFPQAGFQLRGHSDADVIVHAACDALLGAAGLPDIGVQFPNTSPRHRGRNSLEFLQKVGVMLKRHGYRPVNLDCTLLAQRPKISTRVPRMCQRMAKAVNLPVDCVCVKATTHEGLGTIGRGEGLAACAVALIEKISLPPKTSRVKI